MKNGPPAGFSEEHSSPRRRPSWIRRLVLSSSSKDGEAFITVQRSEKGFFLNHPGRKTLPEEGKRNPSLIWRPSHCHSSVIEERDQTNGVGEKRADPGNDDLDERSLRSFHLPTFARMLTWFCKYGSAHLHWYRCA